MMGAELSTWAWKAISVLECLRHSDALGTGREIRTLQEERVKSPVPNCPLVAHPLSSAAPAHQTSEG